MTQKTAVSFTVNVCNADAPYLEQTLRHMLRVVNYPFAERLVAYDPGRQEGKYASRIQGDREQIERILSRLMSERIIDRVDIVPWTVVDQNRILRKYFGEQSVDLKDFSGAPIYQYLFALDACKSPYVLHADSDMLFHRRGSQSWVEPGLAVLTREPKVVVVTPRGGPPQAKNWLERLTGRSFEARPDSDWHCASSVSTRKFLLDVRKLDECLPLVQGTPGEPLENSFTHTFKLKGFERWSMTGYEHWSIHPWKHDENFLRHLDDLIWAVENGIYPFRRAGFQWDMRTDDKNIEDWLRALQRFDRGKNAASKTS